MWNKVELNRLNFHRQNQKKLRVDSYRGLRASVEEKIEDEGGAPVVLPATFTGGDRFMKGILADAMAVCRDKGVPDLFITMTCNSKWPEILAELLPGQYAYDRPDLCSRVFKLKLDALLKEIMKDEIFGKVAALMGTSTCSHFGDSG